MLKPYFSRDPPPLKPTVPDCIIQGPAVAVCDEDDDVAAGALETWEPDGGADGEVGGETIASDGGTTCAIVYPAVKTPSKVFRSTPGQTSLTSHDVGVGDARPVKQAPCWVSPQRAAILRTSHYA